MRKVKKGPGGPKRSKAGQPGTNKSARAPRGSSGSHGGRMHGSLINKGGGMGQGPSGGK